MMIQQLLNQVVQAKGVSDWLDGALAGLNGAYHPETRPMKQRRIKDLVTEFKARRHRNTLGR